MAAKGQRRKKKTAARAAKGEIRRRQKQVAKAKRSVRKKSQGVPRSRPRARKSVPKRRAGGSQAPRSSRSKKSKSAHRKKPVRSETRRTKRALPKKRVRSETRRTKRALPKKRASEKPKFKGTIAQRIQKARRALRETPTPKTSVERKRLSARRLELEHALRAGRYTETDIKNELARYSKARKQVRLTPAEHAAIERARKRYVEVYGRRPEGRSRWRRNLAQEQVYQERKQEYVLTLQRSGYTDGTIRALLGWIARRQKKIAQKLAEEHARIMGGRVHGGESRASWRVLHQHVTDRSQQFQDFVDRAVAEGYSVDEAVDEWFSPEAV